MGEPGTNVQQNDATGDSSELILSSPIANALANLPPGAEVATMRQMMETLFTQVAALQQNQAIQMAGVHDRLDAVELELPLIQEQSALRMRDMETRISAEIDEATRSAVEEATSAAAALVQEKVAAKFSALSAQMEAQSNELRYMRESKVLAEARLNRAIMDVERLCGNPALRPVEKPNRFRFELDAAPFRSRASEPTQRAPIAPTPPIAPAPVFEKPAPRDPVIAVVQASASSSPMPETGTAEHTIPGFDDWKRQFMQNGEPEAPTLVSEKAAGGASPVCPRCYSERTRTATLVRADRVFRLINFFPHRCRSCSHRFYKWGARPSPVDAAQPETHVPEAVETR